MEILSGGGGLPCEDMTKSSKADLALLANAAIWGVTFLVVKDALADASPVLFVAVRFSVAAIVLVAIYLRKVKLRALWRGAIAGLLLFAGYAFQTAGLRFTSPSKSAFITGLSIPMVPLLSSLVYRSGPRPAELAGIAAATLGMGLMTLQGFSLQFSLGDGLTFLCAVAFAGHIVALGYFSMWGERRGIGFESLAVWQIVSAAVLGWVSFARLDTPHWHLTYGLAFALLVTGLLATALAFTVQTWAQKYTTATRTALIYSLEPVFAWGTAWVLTGELLSRRATMGAVLILAGILLVELKRSEVGVHPISSTASPDV